MIGTRGKFTRSEMMCKDEGKKNKKKKKMQDLEKDCRENKHKERKCRSIFRNRLCLATQERRWEERFGISERNEK